MCCIPSALSFNPCPQPRWRKSKTDVESLHRDAWGHFCMRIPTSGIGGNVDGNHLSGNLLMGRGKCCPSPRLMCHQRQERGIKCCPLSTHFRTNCLMLHAQIFVPTLRLTESFVNLIPCTAPGQEEPKSRMTLWNSRPSSYLM